MNSVSFVDIVSQCFVDHAPIPNVPAVLELAEGESRTGTVKLEFGASLGQFIPTDGKGLNSIDASDAVLKISGRENEIRPKTLYPCVGHYHFRTGFKNQVDSLMPSIDGLISGTQLKHGKRLHGEGGVKVAASAGETNRLEFERVCAKANGATEKFTVIFAADRDENLVLTTKTGDHVNPEFKCYGQDLRKLLGYVAESLGQVYPE